MDIFLEVFGLMFVLTCTLSSILLIFREKEEDICKPFTLNIYDKLNLFGKLTVLPFVFIFDIIGLAIIAIIAGFIFTFNKIFFSKEKGLVSN